MILKSVFATLVLTASMFAQSAPAPKAPDAPAIVPKESISSLKLEKTRRQYTDTQSAWVQQAEKFYASQVKPILDKLDGEAKTLEDTVRKENGWDSTYAYTLDQKTGIWSWTKTAPVAETPKK